MNNYSGDVESVLREYRTGCWNQSQLELHCGDGLRLVGGGVRFHQVGVAEKAFSHGQHVKRFSTAYLLDLSSWSILYVVLNILRRQKNRLGSFHGG